MLPKVPRAGPQIHCRKNLSDLRAVIPTDSWGLRGENHPGRGRRRPSEGRSEPGPSARGPRKLGGVGVAVRGVQGPPPTTWSSAPLKSVGAPPSPGRGGSPALRTAPLGVLRWPGTGSHSSGGHSLGSPGLPLFRSPPGPSISRHVYVFEQCLHGSVRGGSSAISAFSAFPCLLITVLALLRGSGLSLCLFPQVAELGVKSEAPHLHRRDGPPLSASSCRRGIPKRPKPDPDLRVSRCGPRAAAVAGRTELTISEPGNSEPILRRTHRGSEEMSPSLGLVTQLGSVFVSQRP